MNVSKPFFITNELMTSIEKFYNVSNFNINERFVSNYIGTNVHYIYWS
jgi:hypothetical protein